MFKSWYQPLNALLAIAFIVNLNACAIVKGKEKTAVAPLKTKVVDVHAHFFNALDVEPGNFVRMAAATVHGKFGVTPLRLTNVVNNTLLKQIVKSHKTRLMKDVNAQWFAPDKDIDISQSLTTHTTNGIFDFFHAAATSRQGIALAYFQNHPQVKLVTPSFVDLQGFAEAKVNSDGQLNDVWSKEGFGAAYSATTQGRHKFQSRLAKHFNKHHGEKHAILPIAGFNPIHGVGSHCDKFKNTEEQKNCNTRFKSFQWQKAGSKPTNYAKDFIASFTEDASDGQFMGFKIYPHVGFYPINNCKTALKRISDHVDELLSDQQLKSKYWGTFNNVLPYAPIADLINEIDDSVGCDLEGQDAIKWEKLKVLAEAKIKQDGCAENAGNCLANQILTGMRLAAIFDKQMMEMWLKAIALNMPVVSHASAGGAEQGSDFEKYADLAYWQDFVRDFNSTFSQRSCNTPKVRVLLAHSLADGKFGKQDLPNPEFMKAYEMVYNNVQDKNSCVALYLDLSDSYLDNYIETFNNALPQQLSNESTVTLAQAMRLLLAEGRLVYGSDYFMNTLYPSPAPVEYLQSHQLWLKAIAPSLSQPNNDELSGRQIEQHYFHDNGLLFLGLGKDQKNKQACKRALSWFDTAHIPHWLKHCQTMQ